MGFDTVFDFELDFAGTLQCIPMAVRYKLDRTGVKLSLPQWRRFDAEDRRDLVLRPCGSAAEVRQYREALAALITARADEAPKFLPIEPAAAWENINAVPEQITAYEKKLGIEPITLGQWQSLSALQRFTLLKLSRDSHDNANFIPALKEFNLLSA